MFRVFTNFLIFSFAGEYISRRDVIYRETTACIVDNRYLHFTTIDFAIDEHFLQHHLHPTDQSVAVWESWLREHPHKRGEWEEAGRLLEAVALGLSEYARAFLSEEAEADLLARILDTNRALDHASAGGQAWWNKPRVRTAAAAAVVLALLFGTGILYTEWKAGATLYSQRTAVLGPGMTEHTNTAEEDRVCYLPDSTEVILSPRSRISCAADNSGESRVVFLSGRATFDVRKDPQRPFYVYANEIVTKVLGTRFEVSAFDEDPEVRVKVRSGQVSVYRSPVTGESGSGLNAEKKGVLLSPNQQVVFRRYTEQFEKVLVGNPALLPAHEKQQFVYEETPVVRVFEDIEKAYGVEIVKNAEVLKNCGLTANLTDESLEQKLSVICRSIGATCEILDARIIINSKGCHPD